MRSEYVHGKLTWVDLESPTREEVHRIIEEFRVAPIVAEELLLPSTKPRVEFAEHYAYLVLHFPALRHSHVAKEQEIDFIVGNNFLVTTRYETIDPLHKFSKMFEVNSVLERDNFGDHGGFMFFYMLKNLYKSVEHELEYILRDLEIIEEHIFSGHEVRMVESISNSSRDLLNLRQRIEPHREILRDFEAGAPKMFGQDFVPYLRSVSDDYYRVHNHIMRATESLHELRETNNSLLTTKQNETMRMLTLMALVTFPLSLMVAILASPTEHNPIVGLKFDFWVIVFLTLLGAALMYAFFKYKKWL